MSGRRPRGGPVGPTPGSGADLAPDADPESVARAIVLRRLTAAPRSRAELEADLARRSVPDEVATRVLDRFTDVGLVDDAAFAGAWVQSRSTGRGLSRRALRHELQRKGIDEPTVEAALDDIGPGEEEATAVRLVARRLSATRGLDPAARVRRLTGMLARKGYSGGLAARVVREALATDGLDATRTGDTTGVTDLGP